MKITAPPTQYPTIYDRNPLGIIQSDSRVYAAHEMGTLYTYQVPNNRLAKVTLIQLHLARIAQIGDFNFVHLWVDGTISGNYQIIADTYLTSFNPLYETGLIVSPGILLQNGDIINVQLGAHMPQTDFRLTYSISMTEFDA